MFPSRLSALIILSLLGSGLAQETSSHRPPRDLPYELPDMELGTGMNAMFVQDADEAHMKCDDYQEFIYKDSQRATASLNAWLSQQGFMVTGAAKPTQNVGAIAWQATKGQKSIYGQWRALTADEAAGLQATGMLYMCSSSAETSAETATQPTSTTGTTSHSAASASASGSSSVSAEPQATPHYRIRLGGLALIGSLIGLGLSRLTKKP